MHHSRLEPDGQPCVLGMERKQKKSANNIRATLSRSSVDEPRRTETFTAINAAPIYRIIPRLGGFLRAVGFPFHGFVSLSFLQLPGNAYASVHQV